MAHFMAATLGEGLLGFGGRGSSDWYRGPNKPNQGVALRHRDGCIDAHWLGTAYHGDAWDELSEFTCVPSMVRSLVHERGESSIQIGRRPAASFEMVIDPRPRIPRHDRQAALSSPSTSSVQTLVGTEYNQ